MSTISPTDDEASPPPQARGPGAARDRDTGRNLLFGLLALQNNFVDREALLAAFNAWVADKGRSLGQILVEQGSLTSARQAVLKSLVQEHLATHGGDVETSLAAAGGLGAVRGVLGRINDLELHATLDRLPAVGGIDPRDGEDTLSYSADASAAASRFAILRPHARGGLGQISVALDAELNREVALKELRPERADDPDSRARFLLEAEITGRLEHPGVVPVYGLGSDAQGRPFYAMRFVKGQSLKEAIDRFHEVQDGDGRDPRRWNLALRQLLNRFVAVCNVMAYAHNRGVIHRDLKPANILLGPYGETLVVDWGLAKVVGRGEQAARAGAVEVTLQPGSGSGSSETLPGTALGTPAYMSPEQAEGRLDRIGPLSDVYSLGATLYCLLTGKPPLGETEVGEALRRVQRGEFPPPRAVRPTIPQGLEAICLKALALEPVKRYPTARALADEIEHWLADEPVSVYREPITVRLTRWGRRHRTLATSLGVLLLTAVVGLAVTAALIRREQLQTEGERLRAELSLVETRRQRTIAEDKTRDANERAESLRRQDYVNRIALALREVQDDNVPLAEDLLQGCPVDLRGWEWNYVNRLAHLELRTYWGHRRYLASPRFGQSIQCLAFSPDGTWIASGAGHAFGTSKATDTTEIRLWDPATGRDRRTLGGLPGTVQSVAINRDGTRIAAGGGYYEPKVQGWLSVWEAATGRPIWTHTEPATTVMSVAFSPDGKSLVAGYGRYGSLDTGHARPWDVATGEALADKFAAVPGGVNSVSFHHDGRRVALAGFGQVEIWDVATRARSVDLSGHTKWVFCVAFRPDGTRLATGGFDQTIKLWDPTTGDEVRMLYGAKSFVRGVAFSPDGKLLASASEGKDVRLWEVATGRELAAFHGHSTFLQAVAFHPDGRRIASGGVDGTVKIWDVLRSRPVVFRGHSGWVTRVAFRRDRRRVASETGGALQFRTGDEIIRVWDPATGEEDLATTGARTIADLGPDFGRGGKHGDGTGWGDGTVPTSPDGRRIAIAAFDEPVVHIKDAAADRVLTTLRGHTGDIMCVTFSPDGTRIATASQDQTIKIWDAENGRELLTLRGHTHVVCCVAFSPDGYILASGGIDTTARVWDATPFSSDDLHKQEARRMVPRIHQSQFKDELIERLRVDSTRSEPVRAAAMAIVEKLADDPELLNKASWGFVRTPDAPLDDYLRALRRAEAAVRLAPENGTYSKTLGVALYRVGRYEEALEALRRAAALDTAQRGRPTPTEIAFLAMTYHRLGDFVKARAGLEDLRSRMKEAEAAKDVESQAFLREAEELIDDRGSIDREGR
jgi:WD40 repeat protein/serine/threonine protein kinase